MNYVQTHLLLTYFCFHLQSLRDSLIEHALKIAPGTPPVIVTQVKNIWTDLKVILKICWCNNFIWQFQIYWIVHFAKMYWCFMARYDSRLLHGGLWYFWHVTHFGKKLEQGCDLSNFSICINGASFRTCNIGIIYIYNLWSWNLINCTIRFILPFSFLLLVVFSSGWSGPTDGNMEVCCFGFSREVRWSLHTNVLRWHTKPLCLNP